MTFSEPKRLTRIEAVFTSIAWSNRGDKIAFAYEKKRRCGIILMGPDGSNPVPLAGWDNQTDDNYYDLQFSPGDDFLIASISEGDGEFSDVCRIDTAIGAQTRLTEAESATISV